MSRWEQFLKETIQDENEIQALQEFFGYCLLDHADYSKALVLYGPLYDAPALGKSTVTAVLASLVGMDSVAFPPEFAPLDNPFWLASIVDKKLIYLYDLNPSFMPAELFKKLIAGNLLIARRKFEEEFSFRFTGKMVWEVNYFPHEINKADNLFSRFIVIRFRKGVSAEERDSGLLQRFLNCLDEIRAWALEGQHRLIERGHF